MLRLPIMLNYMYLSKLQFVRYDSVEINRVNWRLGLIEIFDKFCQNSLPVPNSCENTLGLRTPNQYQQLYVKHLINFLGF